MQRNSFELNGVPSVCELEPHRILASTRQFAPPKRKLKHQCPWIECAKHGPLFRSLYYQHCMEPCQLLTSIVLNHVVALDDQSLIHSSEESRD